jgi:hypothetical protein
MMWDFGPEVTVLSAQAEGLGINVDWNSSLKG